MVRNEAFDRLLDVVLNWDPKLWDSTDSMDRTVEKYCEEIRKTLTLSGMWHHPLHSGHAEIGKDGTDELPLVVSKSLKTCHRYAAQRDWYMLTASFAVPRPYRLLMFLALLRRKELGLNMSQIEIAKIMAEIWTDTEMPSKNLWQWKRLWGQALENFGPDGLLDDAERSARKMITNSTLEIYRGTITTPSQLAAVKRGDLRGLSWTSELQKAKWFARRWTKLYRKRIPVVIYGKVGMKHAIGPLLGRKEDEYVVPGVEHINIKGVMEISSLE